MNGPPRSIPLAKVRGTARRAGFTLCQLQPPTPWGLIQKAGTAPVAKFSSLESCLEYLEAKPVIPANRLRY